MSTLGSSVINKSVKKFGPKKAPTRKPVPPSAAPSSHASDDQRVRSQTPQATRSAPLVSASPVPSVERSTPPRSHGQTAPSNASHPSLRGQVPVTVADQPLNVGIPINAPSSSLVPQKRRSVIPNDPAHGVKGNPTYEIRRSRSNSSAPNQETSSEHLSAKSASQEDQLNSSGPVQHDDRSEQHLIPSDEAVSDILESTRSSKRPRTGGLKKSKTGSGVDGVLRRNVPVAVTADGQNDHPSALSPQSSRATEQPEASTGHFTKQRPQKTQKSSSRRRHQQSSAEAGEHSSVPASDEFEHTRPKIQAKRKPRKVGNGEHRKVLQDAASEIVEDAVRGSARKLGKRKRKPNRTSTPDEEESPAIAPADTRMLDLCQDNRVGKISAREQELREMDRKAREKKSRADFTELMGRTNFEEASNAQSRDDVSVHKSCVGPTTELQGPRTEIVDGEIRVVEGSNLVNRHADAESGREKEQLPAIEETNLSRRITSGFWQKRDKSGGWNETLLDRFYEGLRMFGTDFEMISRMFPGKSRRAIKLKYCKEEKSDYPRIRAALIGEAVPVILDDYEKLSGKKYISEADFEELLLEDRARLEQEQEIAKEAMQAEAKEREAQVAAERAAASEQSDRESRANAKGKSRKGKGKQRERRPKTKNSASADPGTLKEAAYQDTPAIATTA